MRDSVLGTPESCHRRYGARKQPPWDAGATVPLCECIVGAQPILPPERMRQYHDDGPAALASPGGHRYIQLSAATIPGGPAAWCAGWVRREPVRTLSLGAWMSQLITTGVSVSPAANRAAKPAIVTGIPRRPPAWP